MKLRTKLTISFASVASLIVLVGSVGIFSSRQATETFNSIIDNSSQQLSILGLLQAAANDLRETAIHHGLLHRINAESGEEAEFAAAQAELDALLDRYEAVAEEEGLVAEIISAEDGLDKATTQLVLLINFGSDDAVINAQLDNVDAAEDILRTALNNAIEQETEEFENKITVSKNAEQATTLVDVVSIVLVMGAAILLGTFLSRNILVPLDHLKTVTDRMIEGDYAKRTQIERTDEIGELAMAFNAMADAIQTRDIDLEKQIDEAETARAQAERSDQVKSAFLASMSHELRTPLNSVINFTKFVAKGTMGPVNAEQKEALEESIDSAKHLLSLINDVLDMSKIESGSLKLFVENNVDIRLVLDSVMSTGRSLLEDKPIILKAEIDPDLPNMHCDRQRILQILLNIMSNACKFTDKGSIILRAHPINGQMRFEVQDTGAGIAPEDMAAVFEPFKQTETGLRQAGGTGLGMPISKNLVEAHGGHISIESIPGQGTTFTVTIPMQTTSMRADTLILESLS